MRLAIPVFLLASLCNAADVHYTWLPFSSNVLGAAQTQTDKTQYGINVLLDSDNERVTEFQIEIVVKLANGSVKMIHGVAARVAKAANVTYSTLYPAVIDTDANFSVLAISVKAVTAAANTQPIAGVDYTEDGQN